MRTKDTPIIHALVNAVTAAVLVLEDSGDDQIDPDTAVRGLEDIGSRLLALGKADQRALRDHFEHVANASSDESYRRRMLSVPDALGLA